MKKRKGTIGTQSVRWFARARRAPALAFLPFLLALSLPAQEGALTLDGALAIARSRGPAILAAKARVDEARARLQGASARFRENPVVEAELGQRRTSAGGSLVEEELGVSQTFELGGQRGSRMAQATAGVEQATAGSGEATRLLLREVSMAFMRALTASERLHLSRESESVANELSDVADRRYKAGDVPILDVNLAHSERSRARAESSAMAAELAMATGELRSLLGMRWNEPLSVRGDLQKNPQYELEKLVESAADRPDLSALRAGLREAEAEYRLGRGFSRPDLALGVRQKREESATAVVGTLSVTLPFFQRGQEQQASGMARARRIQGEIQALTNTVQNDIRSAFEAWRLLREAATELEQNAIPNVQENEMLARRSYEEGELNLPELLLIRRQAFELRRAYLDRLQDAALAAIELQARSGVLQ